MVTVNGAPAEDLPEAVPVLISGGGPSGLFLALDLAQRGIPSVVIEPRVSIDPARPRAKTTNARTMTHLRRLGLAAALRAAAPLPVEYAQDVIFCTGLTGHEVTRFRHAFQLDTGRYGPQPECGQQVPQPVMEEVLRAAVAASPLVTLFTGWRVEHVEVPSQEGRRSGARSRVVLAGPGGQRPALECGFVIGADGGSSTVRRSLGIKLEGGSAALSNISILFRSRELGAAITLDPAVQYWVLGSATAGMVGRMDLGDTWWAIIQGVDASAEAPDAASLVRALVGTDVDVEILATDPWTARMLLAPGYGDAGVYLVGDAAHLNPPWGGHGFNTCIGDAGNLAWKIAAVLDGWAGPSLLGSYELERRPVAARTIRDAAANGKALAYHFAGPALAADDEAGNRARLAAREALAVKQSEFDSLGLVLGYSYEGSPVVVPDGSPTPAEDAIRYVPDAGPGLLLPHTWLDQGTSLYDVLGPGFTLLVDADSLAGQQPETAYAAVLAAAGRYGLPVQVLAVGPDEDGTALSRQWGAPALLVRPDQHIAWRGSDAGEAAAAIGVAAGWPLAQPTTDDQDRSPRVSALLP